MTTTILWRRRGDPHYGWHLYCRVDDAPQGAQIVEELQQLGHEAKLTDGGPVTDKAGKE